MSTPKAVAFLPKELYGSRLRCLLATSRLRPQVAAFLSAIAGPAATISVEDRWWPAGFLDGSEVKLGEPPSPLDDLKQAEVTSWWLKKPGRANTPNWDVVSTYKTSGRDGVLLVEAKAHERELESTDGTTAKPPNLDSIVGAITKANEGLNRNLSYGEPRFNLSAFAGYQLSNRFAFAWKLATMGFPVTLVYLGFLNAAEMTGRVLLRDADQWERCVLAKSAGIVPAAAWNREFDIDSTPLHVLIRAADVQIVATTNSLSQSDLV